MTLSLDIKEGTSRIESTDDLLIQEVNTIILLQKKYSIKNIFAETWKESLRSKFCNNSTIEVYFLSWGNFEKSAAHALRNNYHGVSILYSEVSKEQIGLANKKGLKVQLWTPKTKEQYDSCLLKQPKFIQSNFFGE